MSWHNLRSRNHWSIGWTSDHGWLHLASSPGAIFLDVWHWRIRWERPTFRPLFSERYGRQRWHKIGRLGVHYAKPRRDHMRAAMRGDK